MATIALILAAGSGVRLGSPLAKQYLRLGGIPLLRHSVERFLAHPAIESVRVVIRGDDRSDYDAATTGLTLLSPVTGGTTRQESARLGLESLAGEAPTCVLIHDAARPFPGAALVDRLLAALVHVPGAIAGVPLRDTLKRECDGMVAATVPREGLWRAQTPQAFRYAAILAAHRQAAGRDDLTDDAAVLEAAGGAVQLVAADDANLKVTDAGDLALAERWWRGGGEMRVGSGFDVHRLGPGTGLHLCGVWLPGDRTLIGHSDADVALHALTDAMLGAIGAGDIGVHFPPSDPRWRGAPSRLFVAHAAALLRTQRAELVNLDLTIICERPKVAPHRAAMVAALADLLAIPRGRISVKATTTEGLGFAGRGEGIAAQAVVSVRLGDAP
ncbi:MAG: bifunctional 2-C-methyl-D-erythritol 4-phosphate cytidylyltransferase/2-C-methyl-D-erythritol 2,4-cyclodiphosphate synthase [Alphaproteobacteria bacterium]|nr:bifunctional 2-C-methyl-D-erythritol 4-phosphate cytidylyltransferase/2-C-methyl-D-erythritol 2,4-cyclodiphosphate synthase [Alphaproteobacteria bacterium]